MSDEIGDSVLVARVERVLAGEEDDGVLAIMQLRTGAVHDLTGVGRFVWESLDEPRTVAQLATMVRERHPTIENQRVASDLQSFLTELIDAELVTVDG